ncbi:hypothetical protein [Varibaculum vaginae]|uniref:hypothetical protein n=1 Tax=Varibaculum vaginae TaxID=2364797 RepID=UPI000F099151|nr:hypothetical protein [Varibaculum vaginae]
MSKSVLAKLQQGYREQSTVKRALWSGTFNTLSTFSWYALPDYLHSRKSRSGIKVLLFAGEVTWGLITDVIPYLQSNFQDTDSEGCAGRRGACECHQDTAAGKSENSQQGEFSEEENLCGGCNSENITEIEEEDRGNTISAPVAFTFVSFMLSLMSLVGKLIFSRGEKRRQAGRRYAHTKQAIWIAIITGILSAVTEAIPDSED